MTIDEIRDYFEKLKEKVEKDVETDEFTAINNMEKCQHLWHYYHAEYIKWNYEHREIKRQMEDIANTIIFKIKTGKYPLAINNQTEMKAIISKDGNYEKLVCMEIEIEKVKSYLEGVVKIFSVRHYVLKELINYEKNR